MIGRRRGGARKSKYNDVLIGRTPALPFVFEKFPGLSPETTDYFGILHYFSNFTSVIQLSCLYDHSACTFLFCTITTTTIIIASPRHLIRIPRYNTTHNILLHYLFIKNMKKIKIKESKTLCFRQKYDLHQKLFNA